MSVFYGLSGTIQVHGSPAVDEIVERYNKLSWEMTAEIESGPSPDLSLVVFSGFAFTSYSGVDEFVDTAKELGPHTTDPQWLDSDCDGDHTPVFICKAGEEESAESTFALDRIKELVLDLTEQDEEKLVEFLQSPRTRKVR